MTPSARAIMERHIETVGVDMDRWISLFAENATLEFPYLASIGMGASLQGRDAIFAAINGFASGVENFTVRHPQIYEAADPNLVFAEYEIDGLVRATRRRYHQFYLARMHVENGQIVLMREYLNPVVVAAAVSGEVCNRPSSGPGSGFPPAGRAERRVRGRSSFCAQQAGFAERAGQKIVLQRQFPDLGVERLQIDRRR